jgi:hypothetical protein
MARINGTRVLMIGWELPPHNSGGLGVACAGLAQALSQDGCRLAFTLPFKFDEQIDYMNIIDCAHPNWSTNSYQTSTSNQPPFSAYQKSDSPKISPRRKQRLLTSLGLPKPGSELEAHVSQYAQEVLKFARAHADEFDLVHAHDWMTLPAAMTIKKELGKPYIAHIHSTEYDRSLTDDLHTYIGSSEEEGMRLADQVITVSYYTKRILVEKYAINPKKIEVVHNGIVPLLQDLNEVPRTFAKNRPVVVFMGRLTIQKGPDYFLELAGEILNQKPNTLFIIAGNGDMYQQLLFTNAGKSLSANVLFSGFIRGDAQKKLLDRADVFVMPSVSEPFGLVALEAAKQKTPVIISKNSGAGEVLIGSPQVNFWDIKAMSAAVIQLLDDKKYRQRVIKDQLAQLNGLSWKAAASKVEKIYQKILRIKKKA